MYGMVNQALGSLISERCGDQTWERIRGEVGIGQDSFEAMESYPDELTTQMVVSASAEMGCTADELLRDFGRSWVPFVRKSSYGDYLDVTGDSYREFIENLDDLHARIGTAFPQLRPPSFQAAGGNPDVVTLHYFSRRNGLASFVIGLLEGLGDHFGESVDVRLLDRQPSDEDHQVFEVRIEAASA